MALKDKKAHYAKVAQLPCQACVQMGIETWEVELHHIGNGTMGKKANYDEVIPLCFMHHRGGCHGVAVHAGRKGFESTYGTEKEMLACVLKQLG